MPGKAAAGLRVGSLHVTSVMSVSCLGLTLLICRMRGCEFSAEGPALMALAALFDVRALPSFSCAKETGMGG